MKAEKRNFRLKMHMACGNDDLRIAMNHVCFEDNYMIATDAHILIKAKIEHFADFTPEEIELLNGKFLSAETFKKVMNCKQVVVEEDGIVDLKTKTLYRFETFDGKYPNVNAVIQKNTRNEIDCIGINPRLASRLFSILGGTDMQSCRLNFTGKNTTIFISHPSLLDIDFTAILMPTMI